VRWSHAALCAPDRHEEEIERTSCASGLFDKVAINDAAAGRVAQPVVVVEHEERLNNSFVHDDEGDFWAR